MQFNKKQRDGILSLLVVILFFQVLIFSLPYIRSYNYVINSKEDYYNKILDSLKLISKEKDRNYFKFNPNKLSYNSWCYFNLEQSQLYSLDSFRSKNQFTSKQQVKNILKLDDSIFSILDTLMYFPKVYKTRQVFIKKEVHYSNFNPNSYSEEDWISIGFSVKQANVIFDYIKVRGGIKEKKELKDIFVIDDEKYNQLKKYVKIPEQTEAEIEKVVTLNTATIQDFKNIKGIGEVYSKIIVDFRNRLGGFKYYYQLKETNVVDSLLYEVLMKEFPLEKDFKVNKININKATVEELQSHPYIGYKLANSIVDFRTNFRDFKSLDELKNIEVISDAYFDKIKLYLTLDKSEVK